MAQRAPYRPSLSELTRVSARIGFLGFGGPAGQIALMHRELVDERCWVEDEEYLQALNLCHLLPGPEAQQLAIWVGWKLHGWRGGIVAGALFVLPGALVMLALSALYAFAADLAWFAALFQGIKAAVLAIIAQALLRIAGRALKTPVQMALATAAFIALFLFDAPFPLVVVCALTLGALMGTGRPAALPPESPTKQASPWRSSLIAVLVGLAVWTAPMLVVLAFLGPDHVLWDVGVFFPSSRWLPSAALTRCSPIWRKRP